jgi:hypothetical protein
LKTNYFYEPFIINSPPPHCNPSRIPTATARADGRHRAPAAAARGARHKYSRSSCVTRHPTDVSSARGARDERSWRMSHLQTPRQTTTPWFRETTDLTQVAMCPRPSTASFVGLTVRGRDGSAGICGGIGLHCGRGTGSARESNGYGGPHPAPCAPFSTLHASGRRGGSYKSGHCAALLRRAVHVQVCTPGAALYVYLRVSYPWHPWGRGGILQRFSSAFPVPGSSRQLLG